MKNYKAIFFDWDGTAVASRSAPVDSILAPMTRLLEEGVVLVIISGTTYENIAQGRLDSLLPHSALGNLYLGLGRGAYNYGFDPEGRRQELGGVLPRREVVLQIHKVAFEIHQRLLQAHGYPTDIVFSRPNYVKIDLMVDHDRGQNLFLQGGEVESVNRKLFAHGWKGGLGALIDEAVSIGRLHGLSLVATSDAKFLEVGLATKSNNVNFLWEEAILARGLTAEDCCFWGDEFAALGAGVMGSDAYMITDATRGSHFFDVSHDPWDLPPEVVHVGGGVDRFLGFLKSQGLQFS